MAYKRTELLSELVRCYEEQGNTSVKTLNDPDTDYPTQMTYQNRFGSLNSARERAGVPVRKQAQKISREEFIEDANRMYKEYGDIKSTWFQEKDEFKSTYRLYFDSFEELLKQSDYYEEVMRNRNKMRNRVGHKLSKENSYSDEFLLKHLQNVYDKYGNCLTETINSSNGPSAGAYSSHFGSLVNAREIIGIEDYHSKNNAIESIISGGIKNVDGYDDNANAHIYVLKIEIYDEKVFYVGQSKNLKKRITTHASGTPKVSLYENTNSGKAMLPRLETLSNGDATVTDILYFIPMYKKDKENDIQFNRRVLEREREESYSLAIRENTTDIFGGR